MLFGRRHRVPEIQCTKRETDAYTAHQAVGQHFVAGPARGFAHRIGIGQDSIRRDRVEDILDFLVAQRLVAADQLVAYLLINAAGDVYIAGFGELFQPSGDVDPFTINIVRFYDHVAEIAPNAEPDGLFIRYFKVAADHALLDDDGTAHGLDRTVEHRQKAIAALFHQPAPMFQNRWLDQLAQQSLDPLMSTTLVGIHQA